MAELNERQELFCHYYVRRPVGKTAAFLAGYKSGSTAEQACRLLARADIQERINQLRAVIVERQCRNADAALAKLHTAFELAIEDGQYHAAVRAVTLQVQVAGLMPERGTVPVSADAVVDGIVAADGIRAVEVAAARAGDVPEIPAETAPPVSPMSINVNECQSSDIIPVVTSVAAPAAGDRRAAGGEPASMPIKANKCQQMPIF